MLLNLMTILLIALSVESCDPPFVEVEGYCFYYNSEVSVDSYEAAAGLCAERQATLGVVKSGEKNRAIIEELLAGDVEGLRRVLLSATRNENDFFEWVDGDLVRDWFEGWDEGEPSGNGHCMGFSMDNNLYWDDFPCENYTDAGAFVSFLCEITNITQSTTTMVTTTTMETTSTSTRCPVDFDEVGVGCYHLSSVGQEWSGGVEYCANLSGSHLAHITSEEEQSALEPYLDDRVFVNIYVGGYDTYGNDTLYWTDGSALDDGYTNYYLPDIDGGDQDALYLSPGQDWQWADIRPVNSYFVLCEYDLF